MLKQLDWKLNIAILFLAIASLVSLLSQNIDLFWKQLLWVIISIVAILILIKFDWRSFINHKGIILGIYLLSNALLLLTLIIAPRVRGTKSWIPIGSFQFQTSDFAALALVIVLANFFREKHKSIASPVILIQSFLYFALPASLVLLQPDMGSMLLLLGIWLGFVLVSGMKWRHIITLFLIFAVIGVIGWVYIFKDYQKERIVGVFNPSKDVLGVNYNVIQSKIAIGSAGILGKGFRQGTQVQLGFLPEAQTDFIFSAVIEEWGIISGFLMVFAFVYIILRITSIGAEERNNFNKFICLGSVIYFCVNFIFNTGSNLGLLPVIGVPYPFLSYGGSHFITEAFLIGMVQSIRVRK